jgi:hypothetical protein
LVFASGYIGEGIDAPVTLVDTTTWTERTVDYIPNCRCDSGYEARWSPDSRHFIHSGRIISTATGSLVATDARQWIDETHYLAIEDDLQNRRMVAAYSVDVASGTATELFRPQGETYAAWNLESEILIYPVVPDLLGNAPPFYRLTTFDGSTVIDRLPGSELLATPGMLFLATKTQDSDGCRGISVYDRSGKPLRCLSAFNVVRGPGATFAYQVVVRPGNFETRMNTVDVYVYDPSEGTDTLLLTGLLGTCLRWSPDYRWLVADDFCDTN